MRALVRSRRPLAPFVIVLVLLVCFQPWVVFADTIRIVTYNILADSGSTTKASDFYTVLQGIGNENVNGTARPIDVLSMQETTSNTVTVDPIVTSLNNTYGAGTYARSPYQATQNGSASSGNGPNAMVYKTTALQLIASVGIGTPSTSGAPRQPVRYQFRPVGGSSALDFYVYVSHMKSGTTSTDRNRRNIEAQMLRTDAATLPGAARILYTGDFNWDSSTEPAYVTLAASGLGQAFDPINRPGNWALNAQFQDILTESAGNLRYRDDCHLVTQNVMNDPSGLQYITGSYHTFGVNGTTPINGSVNSPSNTALPGLPNRSAVLAALVSATDHLPVVADYNLPTGGGTAPSFTGQPGNQTACSGGSASYTVTATGSPTPTYQWRRGTTNLANGSNISGATTSTLTINPVGTGDAGSDYNCVATNSNGSTTSNNASLTVNTGPGLTTQPTDQAVCSGDPASFTVGAGGSPAPTYQWRKGTTNLTNGGNIAGATTATLAINPAGTGDAADSYNCVITNTCGSATSNNASLTVNVGPALTTQPASQTVCSGDPASFMVVAGGSPAPTYQWRKGTTDLVDGGSILGATTATLTIDPAGTDDVADYTCFVSNTCGSTTSDIASLTVSTGLSIVTQPQGRALVIDGASVFTVAVSGSQMPSYQWRKDAALLTDGNEISGATTATLTIDPATAADAGNYDVVISDACGSVTSSRAPFWQRGDLNCDTAADGLDVQGFVQALLDPAGYATDHVDCYNLNGDFDRDGVVTTADIDGFIAALLGA